MYPYQICSFDGKASISEKVPDTITSWVLSAFSVDSLYGLGLMDMPKKVFTLLTLSTQFRKKCHWLWYDFVPGEGEGDFSFIYMPMYSMYVHILSYDILRKGKTNLISSQICTYGNRTEQIWTHIGRVVCSLRSNLSGKVSCKMVRTYCTTLICQSRSFFLLVVIPLDNTNPRSNPFIFCSSCHTTG